MPETSAARQPIWQRIDRRVANPRWRKIRPTTWASKRQLFLNCSCTVFCPCVVSLGAYPLTQGHCHACMAVAIDLGHFDGEDRSGLNLGLLVDIPGRMSEGNAKVADYVDHQSSQKACEGLLSRGRRSAPRGCLPCW